MKNKSDIVEAVKVSTGLKKQDAEKAVNAVFRSIADMLKDGENVQVLFFGTFRATSVTEREHTAPNGKKVTVPAHKSATFHASKMLRAYINLEEEE